jgi:methoxymalonate biosynthesis acyl carrier protein
MAAAEQLAEDIGGIFRDGLSIEVPSVDTDLIDSGLLDSLALVELMFQVEQRFQVELSLDELDIEDFRTIERIAEFVARRSNFGIPKAV